MHNIYSYYNGIKLETHDRKISGKFPSTLVPKLNTSKSSFGQRRNQEKKLRSIFELN